MSLIQSRRSLRDYAAAILVILAPFAPFSGSLWEVAQAENQNIPASKSPAAQPYEFQQVLMGVPFRFVLHGDDEAAATRAATAAVARVKQLNFIFSDYDDDSEAMKLCRNSGPGRPVRASDEMLFVLEKALKLSAASEGAFDPTVGPVVKLWRKARRKKELPDPGELARARERVGWKFVRVDKKRRTVELLREGMQLDFGGIVKGYAADEALAVLKKMGFSRAMVAASGDIAVGDPPPGKPAWKIGVAPLERPDGPPSRYVWLKNSAVSTSGDAFQVLEINGTRFSHIVDPRTGLGVKGRMSVTVVAKSSLIADSLASTLCVLDRDKGFRLLEANPGTAALRVEHRDGKLEAQGSKDFCQFQEVPR